jgi:hypothetical protein
MIPLSSLRIRFPSELSEGAFIRCLEYHPKPIIVGSAFNGLVGVFFGTEISVDSITDGAGAAVVVPDYKILVNPGSMRPFNTVEQRWGTLVVRKNKIAICAPHIRGMGYANIEIGESDVTDLPESYCFTTWKAVVDTGDDTVTLLERTADGSIVLPS